MGLGERTTEVAWSSLAWLIWVAPRLRSTLSFAVESALSDELMATLASGFVECHAFALAAAVELGRRHRLALPTELGPARFHPSTPPLFPAAASRLLPCSELCTPTRLIGRPTLNEQAAAELGFFFARLFSSHFCIGVAS